METWQTELTLDAGYRDYLGHVTAAAHLVLFELGRTTWLAEVMDDPRPAFALARQELDYRRELLLEQGPVQVRIQLLELTRSTVTVHETLHSAEGQLHTESRAVLVRWDSKSRRSMPFLPRERLALEAQLTASD